MPITYTDENFFEATGGVTILGRVTWMKIIRELAGVGFPAAKQAVDWFVTNLRGFHITDADHFWKIFAESMKMAKGIEDGWIVREGNAWWVLESIATEEMTLKYGIRLIGNVDKIVFMKQHELSFYELFVENIYRIPSK